MMSMRVCSCAALVLVLNCVVASADVVTANSVCVYNDAAFVLHWKLLDTDTGVQSGATKSYPVWQSKCLDSSSIGSVAGASLVPVVSAVWGKTVTPSQTVLYDPINATQITFICKGTTLDFSCTRGDPPPTAATVAKEVGAFVLGFSEGLGAEIGFADCLSDVNQTARDIKAVVDFFEAGFNHKTIPAIVKAFTLIGSLMKDFGTAITACVKDAKDFAAKIKDVASALSGNVMDVIKVIVQDAVHVWKDRAEITADCKAVTTDWNGQDFKGAGKAVGDIVGIIANGL